MAEPAAFAVPIRAETNFVESGSATYNDGAGSGDAVVTQLTNRVLLNWKSFNIGRQASVRFDQPGATAIALNRIFQEDPSQIFGQLSANGQIYLINQNGFLFGESARINVNGLIASALDIDQDILERGLNAPFAADVARPAFSVFSIGPSGDIRIENGAEIIAEANGEQQSRVFMFAPNIFNEGKIETNDGQAILAAGEKIYLAQSDDENIRGFLVEVDLGGEVTNGVDANQNVTNREELVGKIIADQGTVTLAGLAVNQKGLISANTAVRTNGAIRLQARDNALTTQGASELTGRSGGNLTLGSGSVTDVSPDTTLNEEAADGTDQPPGLIELFGRTIDIESNSEVLARGGEIIASARSDFTRPIGGVGGEARIYAREGAVLDVSGFDVSKPVEDNLLSVDLRSDELKDVPLQREFLRAEEMTFDVRERGTLDNGQEWEGTPLADVAGTIDTAPRNVQERNLAGGDIALEAQGAVIIENGATIDVSGGSIAYQAGQLNTSKVVDASGNIIDIADADPNQIYTDVINPGDDDYRFSTQSQGYIEGKDAGSLSIAASKLDIQGNLLGNTQVGTFQRAPAVTNPGNLSNRLYRPFDEVPLGGLLRIGRIPSIGTINDNTNVGVTELVFRTPAENTIPANSDPIPDALSTVELDPGYFSSGGFSRAEIFANQITVPADTALTLEAGGELLLNGSFVDINNDIQITSGTVSIEGTSALRINAGVIDVSGMWINEATQEGTASQVPLYLDGGEVSLNFGDEFIFSASSQIRSNAGALRPFDGNLKTGSAGSIAISQNNDAQGAFADNDIVLNGAFSAYGIAGSSGGSLSVEINEGACIGSAGQCQSMGIDNKTLVFNPGFFNIGGFENFSIATNQQELTVANSVVLAPEPVTLNLNVAANLAPTGVDLTTITNKSVLPITERNPVNISLGSIDTLSVGQNAQISLEAGANLTLTSDASILVNGQLYAPAGNILLELTNGEIAELPNLGYVFENLNFTRNQAIWLTDNAELNVNGTSLIAINERDLPDGEVLSGGNIDIIANRGYIIAESGSLLSADGSQTQVTVPQTLGFIPGSAVSFRVSPRANSVETITSDAGAINLRAAEGMLLDSSISARASGNSRGGALTINLDPSNRRSGTVSVGGEIQDVFPNDARTVEISRIDSVYVPEGLEFGDDIPEIFDGRALINQSTMDSSGFDFITLKASDILNANNETLSWGTVKFIDDVSLSTRGNLLIESSLIQGDGANTINISAPYIALGSSDRLREVPSISAADSVFEAQAALIDLVGGLSFDQIKDVKLQSSGDIRLRGIQPSFQQSIEGNVEALGTLTLNADQIYAATQTNFLIEVGDIVSPSAIQNSVLNIGLSDSSTPELVFSAGSKLSLSANIINQNGRVKAPLGEIIFNAEDVTFGDSSLTSVSGENLLIPFGQIEFGQDWVFDLPDGGSLVFDSEIATLPEKAITISADTINQSEGAIVDVSAGGDFFGFEFNPGVGGSIDILSSQSAPDSFAIIPASQLQYAPFDPILSQNFGFQIGESLVLQSGSAVPAGEYAILPARYALLPGAFLVTELNRAENVSSSFSSTQTDGSVIVAGKRVLAGTNIGDSHYTQYSVSSSSIIASKADYDTFTANSFFSATEGANRLAKDAGRISLEASSTLILEGNLLANLIDNTSLGSILDISSLNVAVVNAQSTATFSDDVLLLNADQLNNFGAASVSIGASRNDGNLSILSDEVTIADNAELQLAELIIAAKNSIELLSGARINTVSSLSGSGSSIAATDSGALVVASGISTNAPEQQDPSGSITLQENASINSSSLISLSGESISLADNSLNVGQGTLAITSPSIAIGETADPEIIDVELSASKLDSFEFNSIELQSQSAINVIDATSIQASNITISAPGFVNSLNAEEQVFALNASKDITLTGATDSATVSAASGLGSLEITSQNIVLAGGNFDVVGFDSTNVAASTGISIQDDGQLSSSGDLMVTTDFIAGNTGVEYSIKSNGKLDVVKNAVPGTLVDNVQTTSLGLQLLLESNGDLTFDSTFDAKSGYLSLVSLADGGAAPSGNIVIGESANIDISGIDVLFADDLTASTQGGGLSIKSAGDVTFLAGSQVNISGSNAGSDSGSILIDAAGTFTYEGELQASTAEGYKSGSFSLVTDNFGQDEVIARQRFNDLNARLNLSGFVEQRSIQIGNGNVVLDEGVAIIAKQVDIFADGGDLQIDGQIFSSVRNVPISVVLAARNDLNINGQIRGAMMSSNEVGNRVSLRSVSGDINLSDTATIDLRNEGDGPGGIIEFHVRQLDDPRFVAIEEFDRSRILGAERIDLLAYATVDADQFTTSGVIDSSAINSIQTDLQSFITSATTSTNNVFSQLGVEGDDAFQLKPAVEIRSSGDLRLSADWNLGQEAWRFNGEAGELVLRAAGNLEIGNPASSFSAGELSDGFDGVNSDTLRTDESWSFNLIAGADLTSANILAVHSSQEIDQDSGNLTIAAGTSSDKRVVRTGTGDINVAIAGDFVLGNSNSSLYTAGIDSGGIALSRLDNLEYPDQGGNIVIRAGGDLRGNPVENIYTDWLWKAGGEDPSSRPRPGQVFEFAPAWTVSYSNFHQGLAAFGGGNIDIDAGGDLVDFSVSLPSIGKQVGGALPEENQLEILDSGDLRILADGDIRGGSFFVGKGSGNVFAKGSVTSSGVGDYLVLAVQDSQLEVGSIGDLTLETVIDPITLDDTTNFGNPNGVTSQSAYFTYSNDSEVNVQSYRDITIRNAVDIRQFENSLRLLGVSGSASSLRVYPAIFGATSFRGGLNIDRGFTLFPSSVGNLDLAAYNDLVLANSTRILLSDVDPTILPTVTNRKGSTGLISTNTVLSGESVFSDPAIPIHSLGPDSQISHLASLTGNIVFNRLALLTTPEPVSVAAGGDIINIDLQTFNLRDSDVTRLVAGGSILFPITRDVGGNILEQIASINVIGPGRVELFAGEDIDLGASNDGVSLTSRFGSEISNNEFDGITLLAGIKEFETFRETNNALLNSPSIENNPLVSNLFGFITYLGADLFNLSESNSLVSSAANSEEFLTLGENLPPIFQSLSSSDLEFLYHVGKDSASFVRFANGQMTQNQLVSDVSASTFFSGASFTVLAQSALGVLDGLSALNQYVLTENLYLSEITRIGREAASSGSDNFAPVNAITDILFPGNVLNSGNISLFFSTAQTNNGGSVSLLAPGGEIRAGISTAPDAFGVNKSSADLGVIALRQGDINLFALNDILIEESKAFAADGGDILGFSIQGDIDAGRGAKTAVTAPSIQTTISNDSGIVFRSDPPSLQGSGIRSFVTSEGTEPGNIDLFAPEGTVNAADAGIGTAGNVTISAREVIGADNIDVGGVSVGVPDTSASSAVVGGSVSSDTTSSATNSALETAANSENEDEEKSAGEAALAWLNVFILGFGDEEEAPKEEEDDETASIGVSVCNDEESEACT